MTSSHVTTSCVVIRWKTFNIESYVSSKQDRIRVEIRPASILLYVLRNTYYVILLKDVNEPYTFYTRANILLHIRYLKTAINLFSKRYQPCNFLLQTHTSPIPLPSRTITPSHELYQVKNILFVCLCVYYYLDT